ncbi:MAG: C13 family peptidase [Betaproteobacteria bacterium]
MGYALSNLLRNLGAGLRLACFMRVERLAFRVDLVQLLLLFALSAAIDIAGDWFRAAPPREFSLLGAGPELYAAGLMLLTSALIALSNRQRHIALSLPVIAYASFPLVQAIHYLPFLVAPGGALADAIVLLEYAIVVWFVLLLVRCVAIAFAPLPAYGWLRAIGGGMMLAAPIWFSGTLIATEPWWRTEANGAPPLAGLNAGSEAVMAAQSFLLNHVLENLQEERPGQTDLYYVGFAPYGRQDAYLIDAEAARQVMNTRWGTEGRSVLLVNNPQTLITTPFATVTNLRETLNEIGAIIDPDDDVVMLYIASSSTANRQLAAEQPPMSLVELAPAGLKQLLDDAGIKWRIIVVSACYSGNFVLPLKDDYTLIVTDAAADHETFGCGKRTPPTFFGEAFFKYGLGKSATFDAAFEGATARVAEREREAGYAPPSEPQRYMGAAMAEKLKDLRTRGTSGATVQSRKPAVHG